MNKPIHHIAVAAWLLCGLLPLYLLTQARETVPQSASNTNTGGNMNANRAVNPDSNVNAAGRMGITMNGNMSWNGGFNTNMNRMVVPVEDGSEEPDAAESEAESSKVTAEWGEVGPVWGHVTRSPLVLRAGANNSSAVVARLKMEEGEGVSIFETSGERLRVRVEANAANGGTRRRDVEGWAERTAVTPLAEAFIIDIASGDVVRRIPLDEGISSVLFAHGGSALFYGDRAATVYEAASEDLRPRRALKVDGMIALGRIFLQTASGQLVVPVWRTGKDPRNAYTLDFLRVGEGRVETTATGINSIVEGRFLISPDRGTGFALYQQGRDAWGASTGRVFVEVFNLHTLTAVRSFALPDSVTWDDDIVVDKSGAELIVLMDEPWSLAFFETMTGSLVREVTLEGVETGANLTQSTNADGTLILTYARTEADGSHTPHTARLTSEGKLVALAGDIAYVTEAGGIRYGIDDAGTRLFIFDDEWRVRSTRAVKLPAIKPSERETDAGQQAIFDFKATPDGKRLVLIKGIPECGC